jgi:hypothetical protein
VVDKWLKQLEVHLIVRCHPQLHMTGFKRSSSDVEANGVGATLTWYGNAGFFVDGAVRITHYDASAGSVASTTGFGRAISLEVGALLPADEHLVLIPQAQFTYSSVDFSPFSDAQGVDVTLNDGSSLRGRFGFALEWDQNWTSNTDELHYARFRGNMNVTDVPQWNRSRGLRNPLAERFSGLVGRDWIQQHDIVDRWCGAFFECKPLHFA